MGSRSQTRYKQQSIFALLVIFLGGILPMLLAQAANPQVPEKVKSGPKPVVPGIGQGIIVRTTENLTKGGWVWILNQCEALGVQRVDILVKQDEDNFKSARTGEILQSGELLVPLPGEQCAKGWENADWLVSMLKQAKAKHIEVWAWWPCFHDAQAASRYPEAAYTNSRGERLVDPSVTGVTERQSELIGKLLATYAFDGVSLDWLRYDGWNAGSIGPVGQEFAVQYNFQWSANALENDYTKARWYEARARVLSRWVQHLTATMRTSHPGVRWGAFLLPWQFSDVSQSYRVLSESGLDFLQPMGYWKDWKLPPEWIGNRLVSAHHNLTAKTSQWVALGADSTSEELGRALESIAPGSIAGLSWFTYGTWEEKTFGEIRNFLTKNAPARRLFGYEPPKNFNEINVLDQTKHPSIQSATHSALKAKVFAEDSSAWAVVCLAELYRKHALEGKSDNPVVPILAFHTFEQGKTGSPNYLYRCSTDYLDGLTGFLRREGFTVCPLSRLQGYLITLDPSLLPPKPIVITIDDGSKSVFDLFYPRALQQRLPFTLALVTSWLSETDEPSHFSDQNGRPDATMTWKQASEIYRSGLAEVVSHSDAMHYMTREVPTAENEVPAELGRQFLVEYRRPETNAEYAQRLRLDFITSRLKLVQHGFRPPTVFCWPYGEFNRIARELAEQVGFTHFLLFDTPPVFATPEVSVDAMPRVPILHPDEAVPLQFPTDRREAQSWWLAFLKVGRDSHSASLISATISQLARENLSHPEVEVSRAVLDYLKGDAADGTARLLFLKSAYPFDEAISELVDKTMKEFNPRPL